MSADSATAAVRAGKVKVALYGPNGYEGHALMDVSQARDLRSDLDACIEALKEIEPVRPS